jgi:hypothetical protein
MARITVRPVGRRNIGVPHCAICGSKRTLKFGVCANMCHWLLTGWVGYNAVLEEVSFLDSRALPLAKMHKWNPKTKRITAPSFPRLVAAARAMGWDGNTAAPSQPTFVEA